VRDAKSKLVALLRGQPFVRRAAGRRNLIGNALRPDLFNQPRKTARSPSGRSAAEQFAFGLTARAAPRGIRHHDYPLPPLITRNRFCTGISGGRRGGRSAKYTPQRLPRGSSRQRAVSRKAHDKIIQQYFRSKLHGQSCQRCSECRRGCLLATGEVPNSVNSTDAVVLKTFGDVPDDLRFVT